MNKKILSIFALIMALSFAVSCSNEDKSGAGGNNGGGSGKTTITDDQILEAVKGFGDQTDSNGTETLLLLSGATISGTTISVKGSGATGAATGPSLAAMKRIVATFASASIANVKTITVDDTGIATADTNPKDVKVTLTANDNYQFSNGKATIEITLKISPVKGNAPTETVTWVD